MAIYRGPGGSGDATDDAASAAELIVQKTVEATNAATNAAASAASAASSATSAASSASGIAAYAAAAEAAADAAQLSANLAADSEDAAADSAAAALASETAAATSEANADNSQSAASISASTASSAASSASASASSAASSATTAASSASAAASSAANAAISEDNAADSAALAAGFFPSATGNTGKYLRTNGTTNYWDTVDSFPSQTGNSGKFLTTNGTAVSWGVIPEPSGATPTDDGLVFGQTDLYPPGWSGTIDNQTSYQYIVSGSNKYLAFGSSIVLFRAQDGYITIGQHVSVNDGTNNIDYGYITSLTITGTEVYIHTTIQPYSTTTSLYCNTMTLIGATYGANTALGYLALNNGSSSSNNTILGYGSGSSITTGGNNIVIGAFADASGNVSNEVTLGNTSITKTRLRGAIMVGNSTPSAGTSGQVLTSNGSNSEPSWSTLSSGTVSSVALSVPTGLSVAGSPITTSGTLAVTFAAGYSIPTTSSQTNWDTAYGWGNHASAGYLTSATAATTYAPLTGTGTSGTWGISISGNAATVTNGLYSTGSYADPTWLTSLAGSKITGTINGGTY